MNQSELIKNLELTAFRVTGRPVMVRINGHGDLSGCTQRDLSGRAVIDLHPQLFDSNIKTWAAVWAHELAHVVLHFDTLPRVDIDRDLTGEIRAARLIETHTAYNSGQAPQLRKQEAEANHLAAGWLRVIGKWAYCPGSEATADNILSVCRALYHHHREAA